MSNKKYSVSAILFAIAVIPLLMWFNSCDDSGVMNTTTDTNVVIYKNIPITLWFKGIADTTFQGGDLWQGKSVQGQSNLKDIFLISPPNDTINFYFRSGDLSKDAAGQQTRFNRIYADLDSASKFDTLSVIPNSTNELDSLDFTQDDTYGNGAWPYFNVGQSTHPVYSFYLKGKYMLGITLGYRVYGVFYISNIARVFTPLNGGSFGVQITIDVKLNTKGNNHFVK